MANGVQLATAYISLNVRTDDIKKQVTSALGAVGNEGRRAGTSIGSNIIAGLTDRMNGGGATAFFAPIGIAGVRWAVGAGKAIGTALRTAIISSVSLGLGAALLGATAALTSGLDRLKTIQRATVQLSLKLSPNEIKQVTKDIADVVKGTPIALDEALQAVPRALSAGIKPGKELSQYVQDIADAAASSGGQAGFGQIDIIFSQVLGKGKLMGEELTQLTENGVDLRSALKNAFNWDDKKLNAMVAKGKVGMKEIQTAVQKTYGGLSNKMGETFDGAVGNMKASVARLGANFIAALLGKKANEDPLKDFALGIGKLTEGLDKMGAWVDAHRDDIHGVFVKAGQAATWMKDKISQISPKVKAVIDWFGELRTKVTDIGNWFSTTWDRAGDSVGRLRDKVKTKFDEIKGKVSEIVDDLKGKFDGIFGPDGWFAQQFDKLGKLVDKVRDVLGFGEATAGAAPSGPVPFNAGPMAPGQTPPLPPGARVVPGTIGPGSGGTLGVPQAAITPGGFNQSAVMGRVPAGRYVGADEFATGDVDTLGDLTLGLGDCTSAIQDLVNMIEGKPTAGRALSNGDSFWTGNSDQWASENGFQVTDKPMPGTFQVGVSGTHAQATLPTGDAFNWGSDSAAGQRGLDGGQGAWFDGATKHYYKQYGTGGVVQGAGSGTSDSIPAMLSNGEHVLTAAEVQKMGGQGGVYNFRSALNAGLIPGFAPGGAVGPVDPNVVTDANNNIGALNNAYAVAQARQLEVIQKGDASQSELLQAQQNADKAKRALDNAQADLPTILSGGTPPDRSKQDRVYDLTDQLGLLQQQLQEQADAGTEVPYSQKLQQDYQLQSLQRDRGNAVADLTGSKPSDYGGDFVRSLGLIPSAAGSSTVAGTSSLAGFINMGNSVVSGVIDTGTNLAQMAASAAITAGTMGAGAAAGPAASMAASYGIQLAGNEAKRISQYWFGMAGIGADAALEIFSPFGVPRALGYDYAGMTPQMGIQEAALSSIEKMGGDAINKHFAGQGQGPNVPAVAQPTGPTNTAPSGPAASTPTAPVPLPQTQSLVTPGQPGWVEPPMVLNPDANGAGGGGGGGSWARGGHVGIYDNGGVLKPGQLAFNASRTPESILTKQQWNAMATNASTKSQDSSPLVQNLYAQDMQDAIRQLEKVKRRDMMQYAGRP